MPLEQMDEITIKLPGPIYENLRKLIVAGAKSPQTDETAIMAAAHLLQEMDKQIEAAKADKPKANGVDHAAAPH